MSVVVDSSVWIDRFADRTTLQAVTVDRLIAAKQPLLVADLVLTEVLEGTRDEHDLRRKLAGLSAFAPLTIVDRRVAVEAARHYQRLRGLGITVRKTIDTLIATRCILDGLALLYSDRDYDPFVAHCGLRSAMDLDLGVP